MSNRFSIMRLFAFFFLLTPTNLSSSESPSSQCTAALVRSYIQQGRLVEAGQALNDLINQHASPFSTEIAKTASLFDETIYKTLAEADERSNRYDFEPALQGYQTVLPLLERFYYPFQGSIVEKKRLRDFVLLRTAEALFCLKKFSESYKIASKIDCRRFLTPSYQPLQTRRLALLALLSDEASRQSPFLPDDTMPHLLKGIAASSKLDYKAATEELLPILQSQLGSIEKSFREYALAQLAKCGIARLYLLQHSHNTGELLRLANELIPVLKTSNNPQTQLLALGIETFFLSPKEKTDPKSRLNLLTPFSKPYDKSLYEAILLGPSESIDLDSTVGTPPQSEEARLFHNYETAQALYTQSVNDETPTDEALTALTECLAIPGLKDVRPQILCQIIDLSLRAEQHAQAAEFLHELIDTFPTYLYTRKTALSCLIAFENEPNTEQDRHYISSYLILRPVADIHSYLALLHLFESYNQIFTPQNEALHNFQQALITREEARGYAVDSTRESEPGTAKDYVEKLLSSYNGVIRLLKESVALSPDPVCQNFLYGMLFKIHEEKIDPLLQHAESHVAFNELPWQLIASSALLKEDLGNYQSLTSESSLYLSKETLKEIARTATVSDITAQTFQRNLSEALRLAKEAINEYPASPLLLKTLLHLSRMLREAKLYTESYGLFEKIAESELDENYELLLEIAIEKSLCLQALNQRDKAMAILGSVINSPYPSSLRIKAMLLRSEIYLSMNRKDLAIRQLEAVESKGGDWAQVAKRKLKELYGTS